MFEPFKFKPAHQPDPEKPVEFELKPLDNQMLFRLLKAYGSDDGASYDDLVSVLTGNVVGWQGLAQEYSPKSKREFLMGESNIDLLVWLGECARELYNRAVLKESARKNS